MALLQGSSYHLEFEITDIDGSTVTGDIVKEATFTLGNITKNNEDIKFNVETNLWEVFLSEEETFSLNAQIVEWQARFLFVDGTIDGTETKKSYVYVSKNKVRLSGGVDNA